MLLNTLFRQWTARLFSPAAMVQDRYRLFRRLLELDGQSHLLLAGFSQLYHDGLRKDFTAIRREFNDLSASVAAMVGCLEELDPLAADNLRAYHLKFDFYARFLLAPAEQPDDPPFVQALQEADEENAGSKAARLGAARREGLARVPDGFVLTTRAFNRFCRDNDLRDRIDRELAAITLADQPGLEAVAQRLQGIMLAGRMPSMLGDLILGAFDRITDGGRCRVAVRSSAVGEDGEYSFAGQFHTELDIGREGLVDACQRVLASRYAPAVLRYRIQLGISDEEAPMAVLVMPMVDARAAGVMYTREPHREDALLIQAVAGRADGLVGGTVAPQTYRLARSENGAARCEPAGDRPLLSGPEVDALAALGLQLEGRADGPLDIEWALTEEGPHLLQLRPLRLPEMREEREPDAALEAEPIAAGGVRAAGGTACGRVHILEDTRSGSLEPDTVLVTGTLPPELTRLLGPVVAVVAEQGAVTGHFATVCREFGVPLVVQARAMTERLAEGRLVTVDADACRIFAGRVEELLRPQPANRDLPYFQKLKGACDFILPLGLTDPGEARFAPSGCRSLHDIIRYAHEKGMQAMFAAGRVAGRKGASLQLAAGIPLDLRIIDIGGCLGEVAVDGLAPEQVLSAPFQAIWRGLTHPGVDWSREHFDWKAFDEVALGGGLSLGKGSYASYGLVASEYVNLNLRFGYHFTMIDALCDDTGGGYCQLRFAGGGGDYTGRSLRLAFMEHVLARLGCTVTVKADLLDARVTGSGREELLALLEQLGCLLGATKLMDMVLGSGQDVEKAVDAFFRGVYTFSGSRAANS